MYCSSNLPPQIIDISDVLAFYTAWSLSFGFDVTIFALTVYRAATARSFVKVGKPERTLMNQLLRDGMFYFYEILGLFDNLDIIGSLYFA